MSNHTVSDAIALIAVNLLRRRRAIGWTEEELAEKSGVPAATIRGIQMCERNPPLRVVARLAIALGCTVRAMFSEPPEDPFPMYWCEECKGLIGVPIHDAGRIYHLTPTATYMGETEMKEERCGPVTRIDHPRDLAGKVIAADPRGVAAILARHALRSTE